MSLFKQFKDFAIKGNVIELSVAVVIGAAFGGIVNSIVADVITPLILTPATKAAGVADIDKLAWGAVKYGKSLAAIIQFIVIAFVLFLVIQAVNKIIFFHALGTAGALRVTSALGTATAFAATS